jgi:hydroxyacylglutathione hydrolase
MPLEIVTVPCLSDNYAYIIHDESSNKTTLIDAPEFFSIYECLKKRDWRLDSILITHHHHDHIDGIKELKKHYNPMIFGAKEDLARLPKIDVELSHRDKFSVSNIIFKCLEVPGHTIGHLAFYCEPEKIIFTGDSLMTLGCGRLFEGTPEQMYNSLNMISSLPSDTLVYSGHEYAIQNSKFALSVNPENANLVNRAHQISKNIKSGVPNSPVSLKEELDTNPFLRCKSKEVQNKIGLENSNALETFTKLRKMKDEF